MGGESRGMDDQETEHGMVLYNVAAGTQLHVRYLLRWCSTQAFFLAEERKGGGHLNTVFR